MAPTYRRSKRSSAPISEAVPWIRRAPRLIKNFKIRIL
jgi:hypothetical protein